MPVTLTLEPTYLEVEPGSTVVCTATVRNTGRTLERFTLEVLGELAPWATVEAAEFALMRDDGRTVEIRFVAPRGPEPAAGLIAFGVKVTSTDPQADPVTEEGRITVHGFTELDAAIRPVNPAAATGKRVFLVISNLGNTLVDATVTATDPDSRLKFKMRQPKVEVGPGQTVVTKFRVKPVPLRLFGRAETKPFSMVIAGRDSADKTVQGRFSHRALLPRWVPRLLVAAIVVAVVGGIFVHNREKISTQPIGLAAASSASGTTSSTVASSITTAAAKSSTTIAAATTVPVATTAPPPVTTAPTIPTTTSVPPLSQPTPQLAFDEAPASSAPTGLDPGLAAYYGTGDLACYPYTSSAVLPSSAGSTPTTTTPSELYNVEAVEGSDPAIVWSGLSHADATWAANMLSQYQDACFVGSAGQSGTYVTMSLQSPASSAPNAGSTATTAPDSLAGCIDYTPSSVQSASDNGQWSVVDTSNNNTLVTVGADKAWAQATQIIASAHNQQCWIGPSNNGSFIDLSQDDPFEFWDGPNS